MGAVSATDAGSAAAFAWYGTVAAVALLSAALLLASASGVEVSLLLLAVLLLLRHDDRLLLAPVYGACLLIVGELAQRSIELRGQAWIGPRVIGSRLLTVLVVAALGACAGGLAAIAVTIAPARSVAFTAVGTVAILGAMTAIALLARRRAPNHAIERDQHGQSRDGRSPGR